jgi:DNA primase
LPRLSGEYLGSLEKMCASYQAALLAPGSLSGLARSYLSSRGIDLEEIESYRLGLVDDSHDEHARYEGMICIPYITGLAGVVSLKFRQAHDCTQSCGHAKYISPYETRLYNTIAMDKADQLGWIAATEGELNALTLDGLCGIPAVGIPGAEMWKAHPEWRELFRGYSRVLFFPDDDEAGERLAGMIGRDIDTLKIVRLPDGADANRAHMEIGPAEIRRIAGVN